MAFEKLGYSIGKPENHVPDLFQQCARAGIDCVEVSGETAMDWTEIIQAAQAAGVQLWSVHLPFRGGHDIAYTDECARCEVIEKEKAVMRKAAEAGIRIAVIHPSREPIADEERAAKMQASKKSLAELAEYGATLGMTVAVEDLPRTCLGRDSDEILELLSADERLMVCFDTNHLLQEENVHFVRRLGHKIVTIHVSDYDFIDECHVLPGEGKNDWPAIMNALAQCGYNGPFLYEVGLGGTRREEPLEFMDFRRNYESLRQGEAPWRPEGPKAAKIDR